MPSIQGRLTKWLDSQSSAVFAAYAITAAFATYFCMYAFRKPFAAATFSGQTFLGTQLDLKTALVISQILGYALSKYIGIKVCSEVSRGRRALLLLSLVLAAEASLVLYGLIPDQWKVLAIFFNGLPLGMVWGLVVWYLEGRRISEILLAGLSCSFILASGVVKNVGQVLMGDYGVSAGWMPAVTGGLFLVPFLVAVWLLNQIPKPTDADEQARTHREPMKRTERRAFVRHFLGGLTMLLIAYFFLTAYRDYRDNYQRELFEELGYQYDDVTEIVGGEEIVRKGDKTIITRAETLVMFGVTIPLGLLFLIRNNRWGLVGTYVIMTSGVMLLGAATWAHQTGGLDGFWWMTLTGLGAYMAYVPYGSVLFDRLIASTHVVGTSVFAIYVMDAIGYTGSAFVQIYRDVIYRGDSLGGDSRLGFFVDFTYFMSALGGVMLVASCVYFLRRQRATINS